MGKLTKQSAWEKALKSIADHEDEKSLLQVVDITLIQNKSLATKVKKKHPKFDQTDITKPNKTE